MLQLVTWGPHFENCCFRVTQWCGGRQEHPSVYGSKGCCVWGARNMPHGSLSPQQLGNQSSRPGSTRLLQRERKGSSWGAKNPPIPGETPASSSPNDCIGEIKVTSLTVPVCQQVSTLSTPWRGSAWRRPFPLHPQEGMALGGQWLSSLCSQ